VTADLLRMALAVGARNAYAGTSYGTTHDGDTCHISVVDPLLAVPVILPIRLLGINAPELSEPGGKEARLALSQLLPLGTVVTLTEVSPDKYGRVIARITTASWVDAGDWMVAQGFAVAWDGTGKRPVVPWPPPA
jgi:endonuclease YncB( thermonuclease family)